jgi:K+ transporter
MQKDNWKTEIIRKVPWSATFLVAAFCFFKFTQYELVGWICIIVAVIALFLVIRFEYYEKIIERQEKQIENYSTQALRAHKDTTKTLSDVNTAMSSGISNIYKKSTEGETKTN